MPEISPVNVQTTPKKKKEKKNIKGGLAAYTAGALTITATVPITSAFAKQLPKASGTLSKNEVQIVNNGAQKVLDELTNLAKKGVEIIDVKNKTKINTGLPKFLDKIYAPINSAIDGKNAFFAPLQNQVLINKDKLPLSTFHELGHAFNFNNTKLWKSLQYSGQIGQTLATIFLLIPAITKNHKAKEGEELTGKQKFVNGLRNACPFLAAGSMLPTVLEEGMATFRGNNWAKEVFKDMPNLAKKVAKTNRFGFATYAFSAVALGLATFITKKVKDKSDEKRALNKQEIFTEIDKKINYHQG